MHFLHISIEIPCNVLNINKDMLLALSKMTDGCISCNKGHIAREKSRHKRWFKSCVSVKAAEGARRKRDVIFKDPGLRFGLYQSRCAVNKWRMLTEFGHSTTQSTN